MTSGKFGRSNTRSAKLSPTEVLDIRIKFADGATQGSLAREYGVTVGTIGRITRGETWQQFTKVESQREIEEREMRERVMMASASQPTSEEILESQRKLFEKLNRDISTAKDADNQLDGLLQKGDSQ